MSVNKASEKQSGSAAAVCVVGRAATPTHVPFLIRVCVSWFPFSVFAVLFRLGYFRVIVVVAVVVVDVVVVVGVVSFRQVSL